MKRLWLIVFFVAACTAVAGQPEFHNPHSFDTGDSLYYWTARVGTRLFHGRFWGGRLQAFVESDTTTGYHVMSTYPYLPDIVGDSVIRNLTVGAASPGLDNFRFKIVTEADSMWDLFSLDRENPVAGLKTIPEDFETSIRLGCMFNSSVGISVNSEGIVPVWPDSLEAVRSAFMAGTPLPEGLLATLDTMMRVDFTESVFDSNSTRQDTIDYLSQSINRFKQGSQALYYTMRVKPENALLIINYAIVARRYDHEAYDAGEFMIRVVQRDSTGKWANEPVNDSLWYKVSAPYSTGELDENGPWRAGRSGYVYKPWNKCAVNLQPYLGQDVRIEFYSSTCMWGVDPLYAYFAGDYQPPVLTSSGCTSDFSLFVDTIYAPSGLQGYEWFACELGAQDDLLDLEHMDTVPFRRITGVLENNFFCPSQTDFVLRGNDTVSRQTFMCVMHSALDPQKVFTSKLYATVTNRKPIVMSEMHDSCDFGITFINRSRTPPDVDLDTAATYWVFYDDYDGQHPIDTAWGDSVHVVFPAADIYLVDQHVSILGEDGAVDTCGSAKRMFCRTKGPTPIPVVLSDHNLCRGTSLSVRCLLDSAMRRQIASGDLKYSWFVDGGPLENLSTPYVLTGDTLLMLHALHEGAHVVELMSENKSQCTYRFSDTVYMYENPRILVDPASGIVCRGETLTLTAFRDDMNDPSASFDWSADPADPELDAQQGRSSITLVPSENTVYTLHPSPSSHCQLGDVHVAVEVYDYPVPQVHYSPAELDLENPTMTFYDRTTDAVLSDWTFSDGAGMSGPRVTHLFFAPSGDSIQVSLHTCNIAQCCNDTTISIAVGVNTLWIPNVFTPGDEDNGYFFVQSNRELLDFEISIYNRQGLLVYQSTDPEFRWNGTDYRGGPLPQGAYVYTLGYRLATSVNYRYSAHGTVTMLR